MKGRVTKATDISARTRHKVYVRDGGCCIICGSPFDLQVAHYVSRSQLGLGIEQNLVLLCNGCHYAFDNGGKREEYGKMIADYLRAWYKNWDGMKLTYEKWSESDGTEIK